MKENLDANAKADFAFYAGDKKTISFDCVKKSVTKCHKLG